MNHTVAVPPTVIRTERGLTIAGARTTLYNIMDYLKADWPPQLIRQWLLLTEEQMAAALTYITAHREEVELGCHLRVRIESPGRSYKPTGCYC